MVDIRQETLQKYIFLFEQKYIQSNARKVLSSVTRLIFLLLTRANINSSGGTVSLNRFPHSFVVSWTGDHY